MRYVLYIITLLLTVGCSNSFLDAKPDKALVVPQTLDDLQALLDDVNQQINQTPGLPELFATEVIVDEDGLARENTDVVNTYLWQRDKLYASTTNYDWDWMYGQVLRTNVVLEKIEEMDIPETNWVRSRQIEASARFFRAWHLFHLVLTFSAPYDPSTASTDLGIILKVKADINETLGRSTIKKCYERIIADMEIAVRNLPKNVLVTSRPNLSAGYALLARVYMSMHDYEHSEKYAELSLQENDFLMDYSELSDGFPDPLRGDNNEILFYAIPILHTTLNRDGRIDEKQINLYKEGDLRPALYYKFLPESGFKMQATYRGSSLTTFSGLTSSEMYLVCAESKVRIGKIDEALMLLNKLRESRWSPDIEYSPIENAGEEEVLKEILEERKRELPFRALAWYDLRRLRNDSRFAETIIRVYNDEIFIFGPSDPFYSFPIPPSEEMYNPDI